MVQFNFGELSEDYVETNNFRNPDVYNIINNYIIKHNYELCLY